MPIINDNIKISNFFNEIFDSQIIKYQEQIKNIKNIPEESIIFLDSASNSINNSIQLINNDEYIDSLCLLRSSFESIMFSLAIFFDKDVYEIYKHYNSNIYRKVLKEKYKRQKEINPKFQIPDVDKKMKDMLQPYIMRNIVAGHYKEISEELFYDCKNSEDVEKELSDFYRYLCNFTHPSIVKTYTFKIQNDRDNLNSIRTIFKLNINFCKILLLLTLNFFTSKDDMSDIYNLYAVLFLSDANLITDIDNLKSLLKRYDEYLYLEKIKKYFRNNKKMIKDLQKELNEITKIDNLNEKFGDLIKDIIIKFNAVELYYKYFN